MLCLVTVMAAPSTFAGTITLEDHALLVAFDTDSGALTRLEDKPTHWTIERRPKLGVSFRLFAPLPDRRWDPVFVGNHGPDDAGLFTLPPEQKKTVTTVKKVSSHEIRLQWKNLVSENGGALPMTLTADVTLTNGMLTFNATLENDSSLTVETIDYPYFGDFNPPSREATNVMAAWTMHGNFGDLSSNEIYPHFRNEKGYWGVFWPTKILEANLSPFCLIQSSDKGVYVGVDAAEPPCRLQYTFEQHPGFVSAINALVPPEDETDGKPVHLEFRLCHLVFQKPHSTMKLAPVVLRCYSGDWHAGMDIYKQSAQR